MNFQTGTIALQDWLLSVKLNLNSEKDWDAYKLIWRACYTVVLAWLIRGICLALYRSTSSLLEPHAHLSEVFWQRFPQITS
jgi:hypothetical protein